jgi:CheY-like chemotaxis protein
VVSLAAAAHAAEPCTPSALTAGRYIHITPTISGPMADPAPAVLVVDDEPLVLQFMERVLADAGYRVQSAPDGLRALELVGQCSAPPDLLITDLRMPGLNGYELARRITTMHPSVRVLLVSAADPEHPEPGWPFVRKPFSPEALLRAVEQLVGPHPRGRAA